MQPEYTKSLKEKRLAKGKKNEEKKRKEEQGNHKS
jgi:hypothetical protein